MTNTPDIPEDAFLRALNKLTRQGDEGEYELDLTGLDLPHSIVSVERMVERSRFRAPRSVVVRIDPPKAGGGATHFGPIGRLLVESMRAGQLTSCRPLSEPGTGFRVALTGNPEAEEEAED
jgi:hypothetical protein